MSEYVGFDVSEEATSVCVLDAGGRVVSEAKVATDPAALAAHLARFAGVEAIGLEAGALTPWLARAPAVACRWW